MANGDRSIVGDLNPLNLMLESGRFAIVNHVLFIPGLDCKLIYILSALAAHEVGGSLMETMCPISLEYQEVVRIKKSGIAVCDDLSELFQALKKEANTIETIIDEPALWHTMRGHFAHDCIQELNEIEERVPLISSSALSEDQCERGASGEVC